MKAICPHCEKEREVAERVERETITVRGTPIEVESKVYQCKSCKEIFDIPGGEDSLALAYRIYRRAHEMFQPEEIVKLRQKYDLTQVELASILGWGMATLSRYENGALQSEAHENVFRMIEERGQLLKLLRHYSGQGISPARKAELIDRLSENNVELLEEALLALDLSYGPSIYSGNKMFNLAAFNRVVLFFTKPGVWKTKLNKLLFYADFLHYKLHGQSITGARYACAPFGPVPDNFEHLYLFLVKRGSLDLAEKDLPQGNTGDWLQANSKVELELFSPLERKVLNEVQVCLGSRTATELTGISHNEEAYIETENGKLISFEHAKMLKVNFFEDGA